MSQEHHVLRCFSCETFQAHIVKKSKKWECKVCGEKQSLKRSFGKGSGKDCRNQVMKLNELRALRGSGLGPVKGDEMLEETTAEELGREKTVKSKWTEYLDEDGDSEGVENENTAVHPSETVLTKKRRLKNSENAVKKICRNSKGNGELSSKTWEELNPSFPPANDETFPNNYEKNMCEILPQKTKAEKHPTEAKSALKPSKYDKYLDDNNDATPVSKNSNIFNSCSDDLDDLLSL